MSLTVGQKIDVKIEKLATGGFGIAREASGVVVFVPFATPGDELTVQISEIKKNFIEAYIVEIKKPGPYRIEASCPVFGKCGGCTWQNVSYEEQLRQKDQILSDYFSRHLKEQSFELRSILPSPEPFRYRNRIQLKTQNNKVGFFARKSHDVVDIDDCPITEKKLAQEIPKLRGLNKEKIEIYLDQNNQVQRSYQSDEDAVGFSQVNRFQNENIINEFSSWLAEQTYDDILDLYAGSGNFTFPLLELFPKAKIQAVELSSAAVKRAHELLKNRNVSFHQVRFLLSDVELFLKRQKIDPNQLVVLDPPRVGCSENVMRYLAAAGVKRIIYISCQHTAFVRDFRRLQSFSEHLTKARYQITKIQPFDMFPQTDHIEIMAEIVLRP